MKQIKVLGSGCSKCAQLAESVKTAAEQIGIEYQIEKVTDLNQIMGFGVMMTPGLVIDEKVKSAGKIPSVEQLAVMLQEP